MKIHWKNYLKNIDALVFVICIPLLSIAQSLRNLQRKMATPAEEGATSRILSAKESLEGAVARTEMKEKGNDSEVVGTLKSQAEKKMNTAAHRPLPSDQRRGRGGHHVQGQAGRGKQRQGDHGGGGRVGKVKEYNQPRVRVLSRSTGGRGGPKTGRVDHEPDSPVHVAASDVEAVPRGRSAGRKASASMKGSRGGRTAGVCGGAKEAGETAADENSSSREGSLVTILGEGRGKEPSSAVQGKAGRSLPTDASTRKDQDLREKPPQPVLITSEDSHSDVQKHSKAKKPVPKPPRRAQSAPVPSVQSDVLSQQLLSGIYECVVCCGRVRLEHSVWSCVNCYHIFHLHCIKKWAKRPPDIEAGGRG